MLSIDKNTEQINQEIFETEDGVMKKKLLGTDAGCVAHCASDWIS